MARSNKTSQVMRLFSDVLPNSGNISRVSEKKSVKNDTDDINNIQQYSHVDYISDIPQYPQKPSRRRKILAKSNCQEVLERTAKADEALGNPILKSVQSIGSKIEATIRTDMGTNRVMNISAMLISDEIGEVIARFNICDCDDCLNEIFCEALAAMPVTFAKVTTGTSTAEVLEQIEKLRPTAISVLTRICILRRTKPTHHDLTTTSTSY